MDPPRGRLPAWTRLLPHHLKPLGYRSYHSGKWHVNGAPRVIADGGFDRSYRLEDHDRNFYPTNLWIDDVRQPPVARGGTYYTSTALADFMIGCLKDHAQSVAGRPKPRARLCQDGVPPASRTGPMKTEGGPILECGSLLPLLTRGLRSATNPR